MLSQQENGLLTQVGPGTPMGELLRRYWHPVAASAQLVENPVRKVRILAEDLVLYRDRGGKLGLIGDKCAHRRMGLEFGIPEDDGLRCPYHGWLYSKTGQCLETPLEPTESGSGTPDPYKPGSVGARHASPFREKIRLQAYPAQEMGGLVWAYLGPEPAPLLPRWDLFVWDNAFRQIGATMLACNWLQCAENAVDPTHNEYLHGHLFKYVLERQGTLTDDGSATDGRNPAFMRAFGSLRHHTKIAFEPYQYGIIKRRLLAGQPEDTPDWATGHPMIFPYMVRLGGGVRNEMQINVPVDDTHTWHLNYQCFVPGPEVQVPEQPAVPYFEIPLQDEQGRHILDCVTPQDMIAWSSQGDITDRSQERLGESDRGLILYRRMLTQQLAVVEDGGDPINVFRDPTPNECINLHLGDLTRSLTEGRTQLHRGYVIEEADRFSPVIDQVLDLYRKLEDVHGHAALR